MSSSARPQTITNRLIATIVERPDENLQVRRPLTTNPSLIAESPSRTSPSHVAEMVSWLRHPPLS